VSRPGDFLRRSKTPSWARWNSLRSGFVTEAGRQNVPLGEAMVLTGHRIVQTVMRYFQTGTVQPTKAARLLNDSNTTESIESND
jgi:hypothetical protein